MTTLKATVKKPRGDGFYTVYIRLTHQRKSSYIKTNKIVDEAHIAKNGELTDPVVNEYCAMLIRQYTDRLNRVCADHWDIKEVIEYLLKNDADVCFSEYARIFIGKMEKNGHERTAKNYHLAVNHLERYVGSNQLMFSQLTSTVLNLWIEQLSKTNRAKEMYPTCVRQIYKKAIMELNDEERGMIRIKFNPWNKIQIPKSDSTVQRAISAEACREFFNRPLHVTHPQRRTGLWCRAASAAPPDTAGSRRPHPCCRAAVSGRLRKPDPAAPCRQPPSAPPPRISWPRQ